MLMSPCRRIARCPGDLFWVGSGTDGDGDVMAQRVEGVDRRGFVTAQSGVEDAACGFHDTFAGLSNDLVDGGLWGRGHGCPTGDVAK